MKRNRSFTAAGIVVLLLIFGGPDQAVYAAASNAQKKLSTVDYRYNSVRRSDPFQPFVEKEQLLKKRAEKKAVVSIFPLQKTGFDQFNLVGIAGNAEHRVAIVEAKDGKGRYPLMLGTVIGLNHGKVVEIKNDSIVIEEAVPGRAGRKINRIIKKLRSDE
jgi:type IV pilus assembly protein PilP